MTKGILVASLALVVSVAACGGGTASSSGGTAGTFDYLGAYAAREARCNDGGTLSESKKADVAQQQKCHNAAFADPVKVEQCVTSRACGTSDDPCFADAARAASPKVASYTQECTAKRAECQMAGGKTFADDYCSLSVLNDAALDQMAACLKQACGAAGDCFQAVLTNYGCGK
jgi:hypothetical protein